MILQNCPLYILLFDITTFGYKHACAFLFQVKKFMYKNFVPSATTWNLLRLFYAWMARPNFDVLTLLIVADQHSHTVPNVHNLTPEWTPEVDPWLHSVSWSKILFINFGSTPLCICLSWSRGLLWGWFRPVYNFAHPNVNFVQGLISLWIIHSRFKANTEQLLLAKSGFCWGPS